MHGRIFQNLVFGFIWRLLLQRRQFKIDSLDVWSKFTLQLPVSLCKLSYGYITRHIFINIFQMEHFSAVKFAMGYGKKYKLSCDTKIFKSLKKKKKLKR